MPASHKPDERPERSFIEHLRAHTFRSQVDSWRFARDIRIYCAEVRGALDPSDMPKRREAVAWLTWADRYADTIDPLRETSRMPINPESSSR